MKAGLTLLIVGMIFLMSCQTQQPQATSEESSSGIEVLAENLEIPWEVAFLPGKAFLVTERPGKMVKITQERNIIPITGVQHIGEGGLLGMALHPRFAQNQWVYLYLTTNVGEGLENRVERYRLGGNVLVEKTTILEKIPGAVFHDGGRIAFGPDGYLYITTGDATQSDLAQDTNSLAGKVLRLKEDGTIPEDNPFQNAVHSYGHRNPQGLAWDDQGRLWSTEHGRSGIQSGLDELNLIEKGKNYGWPVIQGDETKEGMVAPVVHSGPDVTWAPAGVAFVDGSLFFAGLRGEALYEAKLAGARVSEVKAHFSQEWGRLRAVQIGQDGFLYITTSNTDGRGTKRSGDDKLIRIDPKVLKE